MYLDGGGLADHLREKPTKQIIEFLKGMPRDAHFLSSLINWSINDHFYKMHYDTKYFINEKMRHTVAHASKYTCGDIAPGQMVLCIHKNERAVLVYTQHEAGKCPHVKRLLNDFNRLQKEKNK
jgi:hypothetical protein